MKNWNENFMVPYCLSNIVANGLKTPKSAQQWQASVLSLVATTVIPRYLCKKSRECLKFLKTFRNISKIDPHTK